VSRMRSFTTRPEILGTFGVVASTHWLATATGMATLEKGGNAFDAAVATGFALQVVEPHLNGPAGEVPIILYSAKTGRVDVICGQGVAPEAATIDAYRSLELDLVPGTGLLAAVVPGAFDAWMLMLRDHGTLELADVLAPAIGYADGGFPLVPNISATLGEVRELFETEWPSSAAIWLRDGVPEAGSLFRSVRLAETYKRLLREAEAAKGGREARIEAARNAWYRGFVAEAIDRFCRKTEAMDTSGARHRGLLTADDMARWAATVEQPCTYDYHGYTLCKTGPWGQGLVALQQLALLRGFDLDGLSPQDPTFIHIIVECAKLAFADREAFYGDPNFVRVPVDTLLSGSYNEARRRLVGDNASSELQPGHIEGYGAAPIIRLAAGRDVDIAHAGAHGQGEPTLGRFRDLVVRPSGATCGDTCHVDVIDRWGNMVSATPSGGWLQSSPAIPDLGFALSTRAQMFWLQESMPASLAPKKRPRTTLTPSLALRDGEPYMVFGTPGGDQQDQWSLNVFLRHIHFGLNLQAAIDEPEFHTTHFPSSFYPREAHPGQMMIEGRTPKGTIAALRRRGHEVEVVGDWLLGRVTAAARDGPLLKAAANPRLMQGYAFGR
jgi:gamma-glutamyltranspeptidase / glutathione hydrolase